MDWGSIRFCERLAFVERFFGRTSRSSDRASRPPASRHALEIKSDQIRLLYRQLPPALFATAVIDLLVVYVLWSAVPRFWLLTWFGALTLVTLSRGWLTRSYVKMAPSPEEAELWGRRFVVGVAASGLVWGLAGLFPVKPPTLVSEVFLAFVLAGLSAGVMSTLSAYQNAFVAFLGPAVLPFAIRILLVERGDVYLAMSLMLFLFIATMSIISRRYYLSIFHSLRLRYDNLDLLDDLAAAGVCQEDANRGLEAEMRERRRTEAALKASNDVYRTLVETTGTGYHILDGHGRVLDAHPVYISLTGHRTLAEIEGRCIVDWTAPHDLERNKKEFLECLDRGYLRNFEVDYVDAAGKITPVEINATVVNAAGSPRLLCLAQDISTRKKAEKTLRKAYEELEEKVYERTAQLAYTNEVLRTDKELFRVTLASIADAVVTTDVNANIRYLNAVAEELTGWSHFEAKGRPLIEIFRIIDEKTREPAVNPVHRFAHANESAAPSVQTILICRDHREINIDASVAPIRVGDTSIGAVLIFRDITEQRKLAQQLSHQATHDTLTGLVNRGEFERRLTHLLATANPYVPHALLYLDLDQFKVVNDTCGHSAGDELLRQIAVLLRTKLRAEDTLARLGGDEFGIVLEHCGSTEAKRIANTLLESLHAFRFGYQGKSFTVGVSIGLVPIVHAGETLTSVLSAADSSCYAAKEKGRNRVHVYEADDTMMARRSGEMRWMPRIQKALEDERFRLYYQPVFPIAPNSRAEKYGEILVRMLDEDGSVVPPGAFLPAAERFGLMPAIDRLVVRKTLRFLSSRTNTSSDMVFAINLSAQSLCAADFLEFVLEEFRQTKVPPARLCFEVTESAAVSEFPHVLRFVNTLKDHGCRFALDDFGTGLSSVIYLKTLPISYLKIDGSFIRNVATDEIDRAMVEAIHRIAHKIGIKTIAECVADNVMLQKIREIGVDYAQGYALGEPRPLSNDAKIARGDS